MDRKQLITNALRGIEVARKQFAKGMITAERCTLIIRTAERILATS